MREYENFTKDLILYEAYYVSSYKKQLSDKVNKKRTQRLKAQLCLEGFKIYSFTVETLTNPQRKEEFFVVLDEHCRDNLADTLSEYQHYFDYQVKNLETIKCFEDISKNYLIDPETFVRQVVLPQNNLGRWACAIEANRVIDGE